MPPGRRSPRPMDNSFSCLSSSARLLQWEKRSCQTSWWAYMRSCQTPPQRVEVYTENPTHPGGGWQDLIYAHPEVWHDRFSHCNSLALDERHVELLSIGLGERLPGGMRRRTDP